MSSKAAYGWQEICHEHGWSDQKLRPLVVLRFIWKMWRTRLRKLAYSHRGVVESLLDPTPGARYFGINDRRGRGLFFNRFRYSTTKVTTTAGNEDEFEETVEGGSFVLADAERFRKRNRRFVRVPSLRNWLHRAQCFLERRCWNLTWKFWRECSKVPTDWMKVSPMRSAVESTVFSERHTANYAGFGSRRRMGV